MSEMKNTLDGINSKLETAESKISVLENIVENYMLVTPRFTTSTQNSRFIYLVAYLTSDILDDLRHLQLNMSKIELIMYPFLHCFPVSINDNPFISLLRLKAVDLSLISQLANPVLQQIFLLMSLESVLT